MCGIISYWNKENPALPVLLDSLKKLEYRGYDSFGFATLFKDRIFIDKQTGKINKEYCKNLPGFIGIGHTRWATHGPVLKKNSHPHKDCNGKIAVVHNGIIENYQEILDFLTENNHLFLSETDSEIIPHLIEHFINKGMNLKDSVIKTSRMLKGRNSFVVLSSLSSELVASRNGSPLIIGINKQKKEIFIASDIPAFLDKTNKVIYLDDGEIVLIKEVPEFYNTETNQKIKKRIVQIQWNSKQAEKGDYAHFMLKEIMEQKDTIKRAINQDEKKIKNVASHINNAKGIFFIGCGTAAKVCNVAEYVFSRVAGKHVNFIIASEFENYQHFLVPETLVIAVSQSGETADVLDAMKIAKQKGSKIISIVNSVGSSMTRISDYVFLINAGPEKAVASTKATTSQIALIILLAYTCIGKLHEAGKLLIDLAAEVNDMLNPRYEKHIMALAKKIHHKPNIFIIGRGINYPVALESAIKIMEISYSHAQGFAGGELKHGPIALIEKETPVIALIADDENKEALLSNVIEVKSRGAYIIGISPENNEVFDYWIKTPLVNAVFSPIINLIPVQLLSYHLGILKGNDVDYPKNLAKSVTVK